MSKRKPIITKYDEYEHDRKKDPETLQGCIGTVLTAIITAAVLLLSVVIQTPNEQGVNQPVLVVIFQTIFNQGTETATATYTPSPTFTLAPSFTPTPGETTPIATHTPTAPPVVTPLHSVEQGAIGDSTIYVFYDESVEETQNTLVELQLFFDNVYITATPVSLITPIPVTQDVPRPTVDAESTATPRAAMFDESDIVVPDRLIAILDCGSSFDNCGEKDVLPLEFTTVNGWRWSIVPKEGVSGIQDLRLELWSVDANEERNQQIWLYDFQIEVIPITDDPLGNAIIDNLGAIIAGICGIVAVITGGIFALWKLVYEKRISVRPGPVKAESDTSIDKSKPTVFISYRRKVSAGFGRAIHDALADRGADVFIDVDDIHAGSFSYYINTNIEKRDFFVVLLSPGTLESEWVVKEIMYAHEHDKIIIPVLINDFDLYGDEVPEELKFLQSLNAVSLPLEHFESAIDRIAKFVGLSMNK